MNAKGRVTPRAAGTALLATGFAAALLSGCAAAEPTGAPAPGRGVEEFTDAFVGLSADYNPIAEPAVLAAESSVVIRGTITSVGQGRTYAYGPDDPAANTAIVLEVAVESVEAGQLTPSDRVFVELPSPGGRPADYYAARLPADLPAVMYLDEATVMDGDVLDATAGRPAGYPIYRPSSPQGLLVESPAGVSLLIEAVDVEGATLDDVVPSSPAFPEQLID